LSTLAIVISGVAGLFIGAAVWNVARNQIANRPLFGPPPCGQGTGELSYLGWLPFYGFGAARRCSAGGAIQSPRRLLFEVAVGGYLALAAWQIDDRLDLVAAVFFTVPLLVILLVDSWTRLIHTNVILLGIVLGLVFGALDGFGQFGRSAAAMIAAAFVFAALFFLAIAIYRNPNVVPFGLGDVYLAGMIGAMVRLDDIARALLYGIFLAGISLALLLVLKRVDRKQAVPYGPFLVLGALIVLIY
jgi:prepilin signal peptidase PulO-like enzyme (type II secretory pathway)